MVAIRSRTFNFLIFICLPLSSAQESARPNEQIAPDDRSNILRYIGEVHAQADKPCDFRLPH